MEWTSKYSPILLSVLRIMTGLQFIQHGTGKLFHFPYFALYAHTQLMSLDGAAGVMELVFGIMIVVGFYSRIAAFLCSGEMAIGYFMVHAPKSFFPLTNNGDSAVMFCFIFLYLVAAGPGSIALNQK
jgi:putative oxidoreductase